MLFSLDVSVSEFGHKINWVESSVFSKGVWDKFEGFSVSSAAVGVVSENLSRVNKQFLGNFHFDGGSTWNQSLFLDKSSDDTEGIMERSLSLVKNQLVGSSQQDGNSSILGWASSDLYDLSGSSSVDLADEVSSSKLLLGEVVDVSDWGTLDSLGDEVNVVSLNILDNHNLLLGQEMEGQVVDGVSEDRFLDKQNIATGGNDLLNQVQNVFSLFLEDSVHGGVIVDNNVVLQVGLWGREGELNETNSGSLNSSWTSSVVGDLVVGENETVNKLGLVNGSTQFLSDQDVSKVNIFGGVLVDDLEDGIDSHWSEQVGVLVNDLGGEGSDSVLDELVSVVEIDWLGDVLDDFLGLGDGNLESVRDGSWVETLSHQILDGSQKSSSNNDNGGSSVTSLNILGLGDFDEHSSGWVNNFHLLEDGGSIVGNDNLSLGILDHFIHTSWSQRSSDDISDSFGSNDVGGSDILGLFRIQFALLFVTHSR